MSKLGEAVCPYYKKENGSTMHCELATFHFPDKESKAQIKAHCCNFYGYQQCTLYRVLNDYWERKYKKKE